MATKTKTSATPLVGKALLAKVKEYGHLSKRQLAQECGYVTQKKGDEPRANLTGFYDALLAAKGVQLDSDSGKGSRGREASYRTSVQKNGQIVIGSAYTKEMGLNPGDEFEIKLGSKHIKLTQIQA